MLAKKYKYWTSVDLVLGEVKFVKSLDNSQPSAGSWFGPFDNFSEAKNETVEIIVGLFATLSERLIKTRLKDVRTIKPRKKK